MKPQTTLAISSSFLLLLFWVSCSSTKPVKEAPVTNVKVIEEQRIETQEVVSENKIFFDHDSAEIKSSANSILDKKANVLIEEREFKIFLTGHTDVTGSREYNSKLGFERARAVKAELVDRGVYERQVFVKSVGESEAVALSDKNMMKTDRRVDLEIRTPSRLSKK